MPMDSIRLSMRVNVIVVYLIASIFLGLGSVQAESCWWNDSRITAQGVGVMPESKKNSSSIQKKLKTEAIAEANEKLKKGILGIRIANDVVIDEDMASSAVALSAVIDEQTDANGGVIITVGVPVYGKSSLAEIVFKPTTKKPFLSPSNENGYAQGHYTSLVIDCTEWEDVHKEFLNPVMMPTIKDDSGKIIYDYRYLDYDIAIQRGIVKYAADALHADVGSNPLIIKVVSLGNELEDPVISSIDADKILVENGATNFLDNAAVVIVSRRVDVNIQDTRGGLWGNNSSNAGNNGWAGAG